MSTPRASSGVLAGLLDFILLAGTGVASWWLVDIAVPPEWCAGGRWDASFVIALLPLFCARFLAPPQGRVQWMQRALLVGCVAVATVAAVMAARLIAGCTDVEGRVGGLVVLPHFVTGTGIGLVAVAAWFLLSARLPGAGGAGAAAYPDVAGPAMASVAAISGGVLLVVVWPELLHAGAAALLDGYCPARGLNNFMYVMTAIVLARALRHGGRAAWRPIAKAALAAFAAVSVADVTAGLAIACPPMGEYLTPGPRLLGIAIMSVGFAVASVPLLRLSEKYRREAEARGKGESSDGDTEAV